MKLDKEVCWKCSYGNTSLYLKIHKTSYKLWYNKNWKNGRVYCEWYMNWLHLGEEEINETVIGPRCPYYMEHVVNVK
jgi:hypothetical protein